MPSWCAKEQLYLHFKQKKCLKGNHLQLFGNINKTQYDTEKFQTIIPTPSSNTADRVQN